MEKRLIDYKDLTRKEKIDHIWEYYKIHILVSIFAIYLIFSGLNHYIFNPPPEAELDVSIFSGYVDQEKQLAWQEELTQLIRGERNIEALVDFFSTSPDLDYNYQMANTTKIMGKATLGELDLMVFGGDSYMTYLKENVLGEIDTFLEQSGVAYQEDQLVAVEGYEGFYLLDVSENAFMKAMMPTEDKIYLSVHFSTKNKEHVALAIENILTK
ncbi:MAG: hypothetical protein JW708_07115 [Vallitaleaceae bacterium]|nr:hypothetical protein [Vallitaleaceae bacterium]